VNGKIYVVGAIDNTLNQEYDPATNSWTNKTSSPYQIWSCASATYDSKLYFVGDYPSTSQQSILVYNPLFDSWSVGTVSPSCLVSASAGVTSGLNAPRRIYFFDENATYVYDPENNAWSTGAAMPKARGYAGVAVVNDIFYVVGGVILPDGFGLMAPTAVNEQYIPIEYGTPDSQIKPFPTTLVIGSVIVVALVGLALLVYLKKRHR
jgi:N-acetylneuraminic acid mutarotase